MKYTFTTYFDGSEIGKRTFDTVNDLYDYMMDYQFSRYAEQASISIEDETGKVYTDTEIEDMVETEEETAEEETGFKAKE